MATKRAMGQHRPYDPGEDMVRFNDGDVVCQGPGNVRRYHNRPGICGRATRKLGRYRIAGGGHDVYECIPAPRAGSQAHRFGLRSPASADDATVKLGRAQVVDVATETPTFGRTDLPF